MAYMASKPDARFRADFNLGGEQAEADSLRDKAFFESGHFRAVSSRTDARCFLIGRTGSGKSATLSALEELRHEHVIRIDPEDLSLPYVTGLTVIQYLSKIDANLNQLFMALWKHVLLVEIIRHRYHVDSPAAKTNFLNALRDILKRDQSKRAALDYLDEFEGKFWCETDERVRDIVERYAREIEGTGGAKVSLDAVGEIGASGRTTINVSAEERRQLVDRYKQLVNKTQLPRLNKMINVLKEDILSSDQHYTYIIIDDLDKEWVDERLTNDLILCLFRTVNDLKKVYNLKVLVALRTNIFEELDFGQRSGGQEEKFRSLILRMQWTRTEIENVLDQRVKVAAFKYRLPGIESARDLLPARNKTRGSAIDYIIDRTLLRPRDAIAFMNECLTAASGKARITWDAIFAAEIPYSNKRLLALRDEWKPTYFGIEHVLRTFEGAPSTMDRKTFSRRLEDVALLLEEVDAGDYQWLKELTEGVWESDNEWPGACMSLAQLLFNIGFIGYRRHGTSFTYSHDQPDFGGRISDLEMADEFSVHKTFWAALNVSDS